jgi:hypothetical protein
MSPLATPSARRRYQRAWVSARRAAWFARFAGCASCGRTDALEVHHTDPGQKVSHRVWSWSHERRELELAKCVPLCRRCHVRQTKEQVARPVRHGSVTGYKHHRCRCARSAGKQFERWGAESRNRSPHKSPRPLRLGATLRSERRPNVRLKVPGVGVEPTRLATRDFKSDARGVRVDVSPCESVPVAVFVADDTPEPAPMRSSGPLTSPPHALTAIVVAFALRVAQLRATGMSEGRSAVDGALMVRAHRLSRRPTAPTEAPPSRAMRVGPEMDGAA